MPLADASYDGWVFPYALEQLIGPGVMQRIYEQGATHDAMHAIDEGVPGGLAKVYPEFAKLAWNHDPVKPSFWEWDGFDPVPEDAHGAEIVPEQVDPGAAGQQEADLTQPAQAALARVQAPEVRPRHHRGERGGAARREPSRRCPDEAAQRHRADGGPVEASGHGVLPRGDRRANRRAGAGGVEHVDIPADGSGQADQGRGHEPRLLALRRARSTGTQTYRTQSADTTESWTGTGLVFQRSSTGVKWDANLNYKLVGGTVTWKYSGTNQGCSYNAGPVTFQVPSDGSMGSLQGPRVEHLPGQAGPRLLRPRLEPPAGPRDDHLPDRHVHDDDAAARVPEDGRPHRAAGRARRRRAQGQLDERRALRRGVPRNLRLETGATAMRSGLATFRWAGPQQPRGAGVSAQRLRGSAHLGHGRRVALAARRERWVPAAHLARVPEGRARERPARRRAGRRSRSTSAQSSRNRPMSAFQWTPSGWSVASANPPAPGARTSSTPASGCARRPATSRPSRPWRSSSCA